MSKKIYPRVTFPLMSISASGTLAKKLTFRATKRGPMVSAWGKPDKAPSNAQRRNRDRLKAIAALWNDLDETTREKWISQAAYVSKNPWLLFANECYLQNVFPPALPKIPAFF